MKWRRIERLTHGAHALHLPKLTCPAGLDVGVYHASAAHPESAIRRQLFLETASHRVNALWQRLASRGAIYRRGHGFLEAGAQLTGIGAGAIVDLARVESRELGGLRYDEYGPLPHV